MIDIHCHLDLYDNPLRIAKEGDINKIVTIAVTNKPSSFQKFSNYFNKLKYVRTSLGMHPLEENIDAAEKTLFKTLALKTSYIGEIGLDFSWGNYTAKEQQIKIFRFVLENIQDRTRLLNIHSRKAEETVLNILKEYNIKLAVFHWYTGPLSILEQAAESGYYFSINPAMVKSRKCIEIIKRIPLKQILTESDGPFITIKGRNSLPTDIKFVLEKLAILLNLNKQEVKSQIDKNFERIISIIRSKQ